MNTLRPALRTAMNNAMCGDACYDENCQRCEAARLQALCLVVHAWLTETLRPLAPLVAAGFIPRDTAKTIRATMEELKS